MHGIRVHTVTEAPTIELTTQAPTTDQLTTQAPTTEPTTQSTTQVPTTQSTTHTTAVDIGQPTARGTEIVGPLVGGVVGVLLLC